MVLGAVWGRTRKIAKREKGESIGWQSINYKMFFIVYLRGPQWITVPKTHHGSRTKDQRQLPRRIITNHRGTTHNIHS